MKLRNKKTGEIRHVMGETFGVDTLAELNAEWEDYEEPKEIEYWCIDDEGVIIRDAYWSDGKLTDYQENEKAIGNFFSTKEEAEQAVEKLKAWKRLKDKGFKWNYYVRVDEDGFRGYFNIKDCVDIGSDLDLLFGGEE